MMLVWCTSLCRRDVKEGAWLHQHNDGAFLLKSCTIVSEEDVKFCVAALPIFFLMCLNLDMKLSTLC